MLKEFDPSKHIATWDGLDLTTGAIRISIGRNTKAIRSTRVDLTGSVTVSSRNLDRTYLCVLEHLQGSPVHDGLTARLAREESGDFATGPFLFQDFNGTTLYSSEQAHLAEVPEDEYGAEEGSRTWTIVLPECVATIGSKLTV